MQTPLKLVFRGMDLSPAIESQVRERAARLERLHDRITRCDVAIDTPHRHRGKGRLYAVRVQIRIPGGDISINRTGPHDHAHEDPCVALRDAFDAAERKLGGAGRRRESTRGPSSHGA
jgi:ribosome-associated translation inhibitor RaiA